MAEKAASILLDLSFSRAWLPRVKNSGLSGLGPGGENVESP
jgi:hypothetical protein